MSKITIAGTSVGGSSYMNRIIRAIAEDGRDAEVVVTLGEAQDKVFEKVLQCKNTLENFLERQGLRNTYLTVKVTKEREE
jgi:hypothetical protein